MLKMWLASSLDNTIEPVRALRVTNELVWVGERRLLREVDGKRYCIKWAEAQVYLLAKQQARLRMLTEAVKQAEFFIQQITEMQEPPRDELEVIK